MVAGLTGMVGMGRELGQGRSAEGMKVEAHKWCVGGMNAMVGLSPGCSVTAHRKCLKMQMRMGRWREIPKGQEGRVRKRRSPRGGWPPAPS